MVLNTEKKTNENTKNKEESTQAMNEDTKKEEDTSAVAAVNSIEATVLDEDKPEKEPKVFSLKLVLPPATNPQDNANVNADTDVKGDEEAANATATQARKCSLSCCNLVKNLAYLKIAYIACTFAMSIFFIVGASFLHPSTYTSIEQPYLFWFFGTWFYIAMCVIDLIVRMSTAKLMETVAAVVSLVGAAFWFIGSCFLFTKKVSNPYSQYFDEFFKEFEMDEAFLNLFSSLQEYHEPTHAQAWSALWIIGSLCNIYTFLYDLLIIFQEKDKAKPIFKTSAVAIGLMANIFFLGGASGYVSHRNGSGNACTVYNSAGVLIAASIMYFIYGILLICESKMGNLRIAVVVSREDNEVPCHQEEEVREEVDEESNGVIVYDTSEQKEI